MKMKSVELKLKLKILYFFLIFLTGVIGCSSVRNLLHLDSSKLSEGEIYKKEYKPQKNTVIMMPIVTNDFIAMMPFPVKRKERFILHIRQSDPLSGKVNYDKRDVSQELYKEVDIGDWYKDNPCISADPTSTTEKEKS